MNPTRGERNNNPGNIERNSIRWKGMSDDQSGDSRFIVFQAPAYGIRSIARILKTYYYQYDYDTVTEIIEHWAPSSENDTGAYIKAVDDEVPGSATSHLNIQDPVIMCALVKAIIRHENGRCLYSDDIIRQGVLMS